ncbi:transposase [Candidatus Poribacteria bacterium]|nr:transposase [Candidatus Poribacteria bacterium]
MKHLIHHVEYSNFILHRGVPMSILTQVSNVMQEILQNVANEVAERCGFVQRIRKLSGAAFFDILTGTIHHLQLTDGITADTKAEAHFQPLPKGSLRLADLGYFSLDAFEKLTQAGVFWISRLKAGCKLFDEQQEPLCLQKRLASETSNILNMSCFIGASKRLPARLVALRSSEAEANKRLRNIKRDDDSRIRSIGKNTTYRLLQNIENP